MTTKGTQRRPNILAIQTGFDEAIPPSPRDRLGTFDTNIHKNSPIQIHSGFHQRGVISLQQL